MPEQIFTHARVVLADEVLAQASVVVRAGLIHAVDTGTTHVPGAIDCGGDVLIPGLVEVHTDNLERHVMPRPKVVFPMRGALQAHDSELSSCGITTVFDAVGVGDPYDDGFRSLDQSDLLHGLDELDQAGLLRARHYIHLRCELPAPNARELFEPFAQHPRLRLISLMDHTPGQRQWTDIDHARVFYTGRKGWSDERFAREVALAPERQARYAQPHRAWFADYARRHDIALATHDDTTVDHVDEAHALGAGMSEFPTTLEAARRAHHHGLTTIAGAPNVVRGGSHSGNVSALALARAGVLDGLSSDYVPGSLLQAAWILHQTAGFSLSEAVAVVSRGPARAAGLIDRGNISPGQLADLVRVRELGGRPVVRAVYRGGERVA
jgi:alpha-D-ribose 1-methylphosphonate 5-triphosphate diphosphatase